MNRNEYKRSLTDGELLLLLDTGDSDLDLLSDEDEDEDDDPGDRDDNSGDEYADENLEFVSIECTDPEVNADVENEVLDPEGMDESDEEMEDATPHMETSAESRSARKQRKGQSVMRKRF